MAITDPKKISFSQIKQDVLAFLESKPDGQLWKDFFRDASSGNIIAQMLAGVDAHLSHHTIVGRREAYLTTLVQLASAKALSQTLGYSAFRGRRQHYNINITPSFTGIFNKFAVIGQVRGLDVVVLENTVANAGVEILLPVVFGDLDTETITVASGTDRLFRYTSEDVSEDFRILLNGSEVPVSSIISDLNNDKYFVFSNPLGALDAIYLNNGSFIFDTGDDLDLQFVKFGDDPTILASQISIFDGSEVSEIDGVSAWAATTAYASGDFVIPTTLNGSYYRAENAGTSGATEPTWPTLLNATVVSGGVTFRNVGSFTNPLARAEPETVESIKVLAPLQHETQKLIRGRKDYLKTFLGLDTSIVSTNGHDLSAAVVELSYVKDDLTTFTQVEKDAFIASLSAFRTFGVKPPTIKDPVQVDMDIQATVNLLPDLSTPATLVADVQEVIQQLEKVLEETLDLGLLEAQINQLTNDDDIIFVKSNRVVVTSDWSADTVLAISHIVNPDSVDFYFKSISNIEDVWQANQDYAEGDRVVPTTSNGWAFEAITVINDTTSGASEPTWPTTPGDTVVDNNVTWQNIGPIIKPWEPNITVPIDEVRTPTSPGTVYFERVANIEDVWQASTVYNLNDLVVPVGPQGLPYVFIADSVGGTGLSGSSEPTWPTTVGATVVDNDVTWKNVGTVLPRWQAGQAYSLGDIVVPATPTAPARAFIVTTAGTSGGSEPTWDTGLGNTTNDNTVVWTCIDLGETDTSTEPTWPTTVGIYVNDRSTVWQAVEIGRTASVEPTWGTTEGRLLLDRSTIWENVGSVDDVLTLDWDEYFVFTITVIVN